ncbi:phage portal protein [Streptacidiphilus sp. MAP5-3]|uniref:phage portal protein n=1 Tax=Streptacidiphilus sp. MAP5-3 TaxID=3156265 RepID=UPI0035123C4F
MAFFDRLLHPFREAALAPAPVQAGSTAPRLGFEYGIGRMGLTEWNQGTDGSGNAQNRAAQLGELYDAYLACPWAAACVDTIARTITAGGVQIDWDADTGEGEEIPAKPANVLALQQLLNYVNPREDIRQLLRGCLMDLLVFGDSFIEVVWFLGLPIALYSIDVPSMRIIADAHGEVEKYVQITEQSQRAEFAPEQIIHISLDSPRGGVYGVSPTRKALLSITTWLFFKATQKELGRKGIPPTLHVDQPAGTSDADMRRWDSQYRQRNLGPRNIGAPIVTRAGAVIGELQPAKLADIESTLTQCRDEGLTVYGVPPAQISIIESGNLGGGTGEAQFKTFQVNTCQPYAQALLEKLNFALLRAFGITDWRINFGAIDWRDSQIIEGIYDTRLRNGAWTLNKYRDAIGEPPVDGGDDPVLVDRQNLVLWSDMARMSEAMISKNAAPAAAAGIDLTAAGINMQPDQEPEPLPPALAAIAGHPPGHDDGQDDEDEQDPQEMWDLVYQRVLAEALARV